VEGKVEYNVAWTGWGRNQKDSWVSSDDVTTKCIEAWENAAPRRIQAPYCRKKQDRLERNSVNKMQGGHSAVRAFTTRTPPLTPLPFALTLALPVPLQPSILLALAVSLALSFPLSKTSLHPASVPLRVQL